MWLKITNKCFDKAKVITGNFTKELRFWVPQKYSEQR